MSFHPQGFQLPPPVRSKFDCRIGHIQLAHLHGMWSLKRLVDLAHHQLSFLVDQLQLLWIQWITYSTHALDSWEDSSLLCFCFQHQCY